MGGGAPDSRTGLITGDFVSGFVSLHEGRGAGKTATPGVEKSMLIFEKRIVTDRECW